MTRRGFTLTEMLVATVVMAILGSALVRMLLSNSRFATRQEAMVSARRTARAAMNVTAAELRMVSGGGLVAASRDSLRVRLPYAFGVICRTASSWRHASLLPADSLGYASATAPGMAWRASTGTYTGFVSVSVRAPSTPRCPNDSIRVVPGGRAIEFSPVTAAPVGSIFYLYQTVTYRFAASSMLPGRLGLWRQAGSAAAEELVTPFDTSAGFRCLVGAGLLPENCPPVGGLSSVRGIELRLIGASEYPPQMEQEPKQFDLITRVPFVNGLKWP
jgi:prepilin-type N-terminal cleavage/methylation domain-containing protein